MKVTYRIPASKPYGYIEIENEVLDGTSPEEVLSNYDVLVKRYESEEVGLDTREFNDCLDKYLTDGEMDSHCYERMNTEQRMIVQTIKRAFKRINRE